MLMTPLLQYAWYDNQTTTLTLHEQHMPYSFKKQDKSCKCKPILTGMAAVSCHLQKTARSQRCFGTGFSQCKADDIETSISIQAKDMGPLFSLCREERQKEAWLAHPASHLSSPPCRRKSYCWTPALLPSHSSTAITWEGHWHSTHNARSHGASHQASCTWVGTYLKCFPTGSSQAATCILHERLWYSTIPGVPTMDSPNPSPFNRHYHPVCNLLTFNILGLTISDQDIGIYRLALGSPFSCSQMIKSPSNDLMDGMLLNNFHNFISNKLFFLNFIRCFYVKQFCYISVFCGVCKV